MDEDELELELEQMYVNENNNECKSDNIDDNNKHLEMTNIGPILGQIEGLEENATNGIELKVDNWKEWNKQKVIEWIETILRENNFENDAIETFINRTFIKLEITGKILLKLKTNDSLWSQFQIKIESVSFGIWVALSSEILNLKV